MAGKVGGHLAANFWGRPIVVLPKASGMMVSWPPTLELRFNLNNTKEL